MTLQTTNIPSVKDAVIEIDTTAAPDFSGDEVAIEDAAISVNVSGGEVATRDLSPINGDVHSKSGKTASFDIQVQMIFTDGETTDLWPVIFARKGLDFGIRWSPKGGSTGDSMFTSVGTLYRVDPPSLSGDGDVLYQFAVRGDITHAQVT